MKIFRKVVIWIKNLFRTTELPEVVYVIKDDLKKWVTLYDDDTLFGKIVFWKSVSKYFPVNSKELFHAAFVSFDPTGLFIFEKNKKFRYPKSKQDAYTMLERAIVLDVSRKKKSKVEKNTVVLDVLEKKKPKAKKKKEAV